MFVPPCYLNGIMKLSIRLASIEDEMPKSDKVSGEGGCSKNFDSVITGDRVKTIWSRSSGVGFSLSRD